MADNRIAYGLAKKYGIDTAGMSPKEVWEALKKKGVTPEHADRQNKQSLIAWAKQKAFPIRTEADGTISESTFRALEEIRDNYEGENIGWKSSGKSYIELPEREYAELCSAVRTRYTNKIPPKGQMFYGNYYYLFKYTKRSEGIVCTLKIKIEDNEEYINTVMEKYSDD